MCALCGGAAAKLFPMSGIIAIGFGNAEVTRDGVVVYDEMSTERKHLEDKGEDTTEWPPFWTGADAEKAALADPDHDWKILIHGPMSGGEWTRTEPGHWVQTAVYEGFA